MKKLSVLLSVLLVIVFTFASCSSSLADAEYYGSEKEVSYSDGMNIVYSSSSSLKKVSDSENEEAEDSSDYERKIIRNMELNLESKEFDSASAHLTNLCTTLGGYVESSSVKSNGYSSSSSRYANFVFRIPAEKLDEFVNNIGDSIKICSQSESSEDITESYYDLEARLTSLENQEQRLLEMLNEAETLDYMLQIEDKLEEVRYNIQRIYNSIKLYDSQVSMSSVSVYLSEVIEYEYVPYGFGARISKAFTDSWKLFAEGCQDFAVWFISAFPTLLILAAITVAIIFIIKGIIRHSKKKKGIK